jgi:hypothetical protein
LDLKREEYGANLNCPSLEAMSKNIVAQKALVTYLKLQVDEGNVEFEKVHMQRGYRCGF